jgi:8-oxo-dGTP diphosphatase
METQKEEILLEVGVKAFVYKNPGKYLVLARMDPYPGETMPGWDIPGGRIIPGEAVEKALAREIKEETGLRLEKIHKVLTVQDILRVKGRHIVRITFLARCSGKVKINKREHVNYKWLTADEIKNLYHDLYLKPVLKILTSG